MPSRQRAQRSLQAGIEGGGIAHAARVLQHVTDLTGLQRHGGCPGQRRQFVV